MKRVTITSIKLSNFMGVQKLEADFDGKSVSIRGVNGAGKTTIASALTWLLTGKDVNGKHDTNFEVKPLNEDNSPIHHVDSVVEATYNIEENSNSKQVTLKRTRREEWQGARGLDAELKTHTTMYECNGMPVERKKDYDALVEELFGADTRILTDPFYFIDTVKWEERRDMLLSIVGDDGDVSILSKDKYAPIRDGVSEHSYMKYKGFLSKNIKAINDEKSENVIRIDQEYKGVIAKPETTVDILEEQKKEVTKAIAKLQNERADTLKNNPAQELKRNITSLKKELSDIELNHKNFVNQEVYKTSLKAQGIEDNISKLSRGIDNHEFSYNNNDRQVKMNIELLAKARETLENLNKTTFNDNDAICPTCGQMFPEDRITELKAKFEKDKQRVIASSTTEIENLNKLIKDKVDENDQLRSDIKGNRRQIETLKGDLEIAKTELAATKNKADAHAQLEAYIKVQKEIAILESELATNPQQSEFAVMRLDALIKKEQEKLDAINTMLSEHNAVKRAEDELKRLKERNDELVIQEDDLKVKEQLLDEFIQEKISITEEKVNSLFRTVKFRLFRMQMNGYVDMVCDAMVQGVPFRTSLNHGSQILAGLECIDVISKYKGLSLPVFIDHAEAVTEPLLSHSQLIKLVATTETFMDMHSGVTVQGVRGKKLLMSQE